MNEEKSEYSFSEELEKVLISEEEITKRIDQIATKINSDYKDITEPLILVGVLKGSFIFMSDLSRKIKVPHIVDFIAISSYGRRGDKRGEVRMVMDTREDVSDHHVLLVEDILDSGNTLNYLTKLFKARSAKSVETAVFLDKPERHEVDVKIKYLGFTIPDIWVVGYGLDYKEKFRTLPFIAEMKKIEEKNER